MRYLTLFLILFSIPLITFAAGKEHQREVSLIRGNQAYQRGECDRASVHFDNYLRQGGKRERVIRLLAFCEVKQNHAQVAIGYLEEIFNKDNNDSEVAVLLFKLYLSEKDYKKAKSFAPLVGTLAEKDPKINFWIALLYFNLERYPEVVKYLNRYTPDLKDQDLYEKTMLIKGITRLQLKQTLAARKIFKDLLVIRELSETTKTEAEKALKIINALLQKKKEGRVQTTFTSRLLFDSNVNSQPPFSDHYQSDLSGAPELYDSDLTSMAVRKEFELNITWRAVQSKKHQLFTGGTLFAGVHFPYVVDGVFDPQDYDTMMGSLLLGYEFTHSFSRSNLLKLGIIFFENFTFFSILENFTYYSRSENIYTYLYFTETERIATRLSLYARNFSSEIDAATPEEVLSGYYLKPELEQIFTVSERLNLSISGGYIYDRTDGIQYQNSGFTVRAGISVKPFNFLLIDLVGGLDKLWYEAYTTDDSGEEIERLDTALKGDLTLRFLVSKLFHFGLQYSYTSNDSNRDDYTYDKHVGGFFFNLFF